VGHDHVKNNTLHASLRLACATLYGIQRVFECPVVRYPAFSPTAVHAGQQHAGCMCWHACRKA
jgi:hypothetical protein